MSKILKRPMFRKGGPTNEGVVSLAQPRRQYAYSNFEDLMKQFPESASAIKSGVAREALISSFAGQGRSKDERLGDLLISGGLNLMSARPGGNIFATAAESFKQPTAQLLKEKQEEDRFKRGIKLQAITGAISDEEKMKLAKVKAQKEYAKDKLLSEERRKIDIEKELAKIYGPQIKDGMELRGAIVDRESISKMSKTLVDIEKGKILGPGNRPLVGANVSSAPIIDGRIINKEFLDPKTNEPNPTYYIPGKFYVNHDGSVYLYEGKNKFKRIDGYQGQ
jgi:hypothetical protein